MSNALRLVRDYGFDVLGLQVIRWRAEVGNWASRRVAAAAGFRFDGTVRRLLVHRGELVDGWLATITARRPRRRPHWAEPPPVRGPQVALRAVCRLRRGPDRRGLRGPGTQHWLASLPSPYELRDAHDYLEAIRELAALGRGLAWCVADPDDRPLPRLGRRRGPRRLRPPGRDRLLDTSRRARPGADRGGRTARDRLRLEAAGCRLDHDPLRRPQHRLPACRAGRRLPQDRHAARRPNRCATAPSPTSCSTRGRSRPPRSRGGFRADVRGAANPSDVGKSPGDAAHQCDRNQLPGRHPRCRHGRVRP